MLRRMFFMVKLKSCELLIDSTLVRMSIMLSPLFEIWLLRFLQSLEEAVGSIMSWL